MRRVTSFYEFLCDYEKAVSNNVATAPTYFAELYESGAKDVISFIKDEYLRRFEPLMSVQKK